MAMGNLSDQRRLIGDLRYFPIQAFITYKPLVAT